MEKNSDRRRYDRCFAGVSRQRLARRDYVGFVDYLCFSSWGAKGMITQDVARRITQDLETSMRRALAPLVGLCLRKPVAPCRYPAPQRGARVTIPLHSQDGVAKGPELSAMLSEIQDRIKAKHARATGKAEG